ncbi:hypothetical protein [uncultured Porphyromonas sp.]|uniref:hypothetical protein n=1 Tax=uncultured Porphyromonas sp. TaxID=159274 RepID=UPI002635C8E8|nr:hypothetical protein [uncultured Porphyromonas sp.]
MDHEERIKGEMIIWIRIRENFPPLILRLDNGREIGRNICVRLLSLSSRRARVEWLEMAIWRAVRMTSLSTFRGWDKEHEKARRIGLRKVSYPYTHRIGCWEAI